MLSTHSQSLIALLLAGGLVTASAGNSVAGQRLIRYRRVVHLSHVIDGRMPRWPGDPPLELETVARPEREGYFLRRFSMGEHSGTHLNAPSSFYPGQMGVDGYPAQSLVAPAVVIDVRRQAAENADYALTRDGVLRWEDTHGRIAAGSVVILYTGWQAKWSDPAAFFNADSAGGLHFPGFAPGTARFLLDERAIAGVGTDAPGVDPGQDVAFGTNRQVLAGAKIVLENLTNLDQLPTTGSTLVVGVLRLRDGSGSPAAVIGFIP